MRNLLYLILFHCICQSSTLENDIEDFLDTTDEEVDTTNEEVDTTNEEMDIKPLKMILEAEDRRGRHCGYWHGSRVVFDVETSIMNHMVNPGRAIVFNLVNVNLGRAYSRSSGMFMAPRFGIYFFSYTSLPFRGLHTDVVLMKNGRKISRIHSVLARSTSQLASKNAILKLRRGDHVWVHLEKGKLWSNDGSISFQGFLLTPLC
ncbi:cerebellin-4-like [Hypanus sabinus]|uniref:cerebellin-4-like n=1 Tax=Hypanus sabinus TaxID=79690 RepID=UPI0028C38A5F|nr:cerebellin-4-like [Hypanus sabinus]